MARILVAAAEALAARLLAADIVQRLHEDGHDGDHLPTGDRIFAEVRECDAVIVLADPPAPAAFAAAAYAHALGKPTLCLGPRPAGTDPMWTLAHDADGLEGLAEVL